MGLLDSYSDVSLRPVWFPPDGDGAGTRARRNERPRIPVRRGPYLRDDGARQPVQRRPCRRFWKRNGKFTPTQVQVADAGTA